MLLARGLAGDVQQAEALLQKARPGIRLKPAQRRLLERLQPTLSTRAGPGQQALTVSPGKNECN